MLCKLTSSWSTDFCRQTKDSRSKPEGYLPATKAEYEIFRRT